MVSGFFFFQRIKYESITGTINMICSKTLCYRAIWWSVQLFIEIFIHVENAKVKNYWYHKWKDSCGLYKGMRFFNWFIMYTGSSFSRTGGVVSIISNELLHNKLQNSDQRGPIQYLRYGLSEVISYGDDSTKVSYICKYLEKPNTTA